MAEVVNLRMARKRRERANKARTASDARARHGVSKAGKALGKAEATRAARELDGAKLERDD